MDGWMDELPILSKCR